MENRGRGYHRNPGQLPVSDCTGPETKKNPNSSKENGFYGPGIGNLIAEKGPIHDSEPVWPQGMTN